MSTTDSDRSGYLFILGSVLIWSGWMVTTRFLARGALSPYDITALRFGIAGGLLLPIVWRKGLRIGPHGYASSLAMTAFLGAPYILVVSTGMRFAPAAHGASIINGFMVLFSVLLGGWWLKEPFPPRKRLGTAVLLAGMACVVYSRIDGQANIGHLFFAVGGTMWAFYGVLLRRWGIASLHSTAVVSVLSAVFFLPVYLLFLPSRIPEAPWSLLLFHGVYQGLLTSILALYFYGRAIHLLGATTTSAFVPLVPILTLLIGIPGLGEVPSAVEVLGVILVFVGLFLVLKAGGLGRARRGPRSS